MSNHWANTKTHYQLTGSQLERLSDNVNKLEAEMDNYNVTFTENNAVFNVVSKAVLPEDVAGELLNHDSIGKNLYEEFVTSRIQGEESIWGKLTKRKLRTFKSQLAVTRKKVDGKVFKFEKKNLCYPDS